MEDVLLGSPRLDGLPRALDPMLPAEVFAPSAPPFARETPHLRRWPKRERDEDVLARGSIVDKYRIDGLLGKGGFATVYRATHMLLGTRVAIKLLRPTVLRRQQNLATLLCEEARFAARINHPNVVRILDVTSGPLTYIVMEYIDGLSLAQRIERGGPLPGPALLRVGLQVVSGLMAGLEQGLIHRDIKPANILLARSGEVKIVDFGLARQNAAEPADAPRPRRPSIIGTHGYMSPEQSEDPEAVDFRADVYSLGVTLYEAATGAPAFPMTDPATPPSGRPVPLAEERISGFPTAISSLLAWMTARNREERPGSYASLHSTICRTLATIKGRAR